MKKSKIVKVVAVAFMLLLSGWLLGNQVTSATNTSTTGGEKLQLSKTYNIGLSTFTLAVSWQAETIDVVTKAAKDYGDKINFSVYNANGKVADQITQIENLIAKKYDAILVDSSSQIGLNPVLKKAKDAGIVVVNYNSVVSDNNAVTSKIYTDQKEWGAILAEFLVKKLNGKGNIVCLNGFSGNQISADRWEGAQGVFKKNPGIKILAEANAEWGQAPAEAKMSAWVAAFPKINGVWSQGGAMTLGAINVYNKKGMALVPMTGEDQNGFLKEWKKNQAKGFSSIALGQPEYIAVIALNAALRSLEGYKVPNDLKLTIPVITDDNLDQFVDPSKPDEYWVHDKYDQAMIDKILGPKVKR